MPQAVDSTQKHINIAQIKDRLVINRAGDLRAVLEVIPVNFALRSEEDQNVIIGQYQSFLNSLTFPIQIVIQSRKLDLYPYLKQSAQLVDQQPNELLALQASEYIEFIKRLTTLVNIMDKKFYLVIPFTPPPTQKVGGLKGLISHKTATVSFSPQQFTQYQDLINQRVATIETSLNAIGLKTIRLNSRQLVELYYYAYNPEEAVEERLAEEVAEIEAPIIHRANVSAREAVNNLQPVGQTPGGQPTPADSTPRSDPNQFGVPIENKANLMNDQANPQPPAP